MHHQRPCAHRRIPDHGHRRRNNFQINAGSNATATATSGLDRSAAGAAHFRRPAVGEDIADFFRSYFNGLQRQRPVLRCLGVAPDPVQRPQPIGPTANANAVDVGDLLGPLGVEEVHQLLAQAARGRLAGIAALDRLPRQDEPKLRLDGSDHFGRRLKGRKPFNDKGFHHLRNLGHVSIPPDVW